MPLTNNLWRKDTCQLLRVSVYPKRQTFVQTTTCVFTRNRHSSQITKAVESRHIIVTAATAAPKNESPSGPSGHLISSSASPLQQIFAWRCSSAAVLRNAAVWPSAAARARAVVSSAAAERHTPKDVNRLASLGWS